MFDASCKLNTIGRWLVLSGAMVMGLTFGSCSADKSGEMPLYVVERGDFNDILTIDGYTEPVNSANVHCPRHVGGSIVSIVENGTFVKKGDVVCVIEDLNIAESCENLELELESAHAEIEKLKASHQLEYALLEAQVKNNDAEAILSQSDSIQMLYMSPQERSIKMLQLQSAEIKRNQLLSKLDITKRIQEIDIMRIEKRIEHTRRRLNAEREKLASLTLRAPKDGIAIRGRRWPWSDEKWNIGDHIHDGRVAVMIPDLDQIKVLIHAQETEYKRINMNDSIAYTFDATPDNYGWGRITKMAARGQTRTEGSEIKTFEIEASVDSLRLPAEPGLSVRCHIFLTHLPDTIIAPTISIFDRDSLKVVYVRQGREYEEREVLLGTSSPTHTIIVKGLNEGEQIALLKPKEIKKRKQLH